MFRSLTQQSISPSKTAPSTPSNLRQTQTIMSHTSGSSRSRFSHSQTFSGPPEPHKQSKPRSNSPAGSFLTSIFATFTPAALSNGLHGQSNGPSSSLKTHRSEVELRRDYLSPEREREISEIWDLFKRQSQEIGEDKMTSFPCITEYDYEDQEEEDGHRKDTRQRVA